MILYLIFMLFFLVLILYMVIGILQEVPYVGSSSIALNISLGSKSTQAVMERLMQQMNSQGLFNTTESIDENPYDFTNTGRNGGTAESERVMANVVQEVDGGTITESQGNLRQKGMEIDPTITILETQEIVHRFELDEQVQLLHPINGTVVAIAKISSIATSGQLHNRLQPNGYYKVSIQEALVDEAPLMITNMDDDPPQLVVRDAVGTMTAWKWDRIQSMEHM